MFNLEKKIMKKRRIVFLCLFIILTINVHLNAQVSIGGTTPQAPKSFSILELISVPAINVGGLRLPQLNEGDKATIHAGMLANVNDSRGLFIYNTDKSCIEYWDGTKWIAPGSNVELPWQISGASDLRNDISTSEDIYHIGSVSIGDDSDADPTAILNVHSSNKGVLLPRVALTGAADRTTIPNPTTGLLVYNTGTNPSFPTVGYMFWDGLAWKIFANASAEPAIAAMDCEVADMNPGQQVIGEKPLIAGTLLQIPYHMSNGGSFSGITLTSVGNPNVKATIAAGTLTMGSGVLNFSLTGTPTINQQAPNGIVFDLTPFIQANPGITGNCSSVAVGDILSASILSTAVMGYLALGYDNTGNDNGAQVYSLQCNSPDGKFSIRVYQQTGVSSIVPGNGYWPNVQIRNNLDSTVAIIWNYCTQYGGLIVGSGVLSIPSQVWGGNNDGTSWVNSGATGVRAGWWGNPGIYDASGGGPEYRRYTWIPAGTDKVSYEARIMAAIDATRVQSGPPEEMKVYIKIEEVAAQ